MPYFTQISYLKTLLLVAILISLIALSGCSSYNIIEPSPIVESNFKQHAQTKQNKLLSVSTSILSAEESKAIFGLPLKLIGVQVIWVSIENRDKYPHWLIYPALDPAYFSPDEVAYTFKSAMSDKDNKLLMQRLRKLSFKNPIQQGKSKSGFIFVNLDEDFKKVSIQLLGNKKLTIFNFFHTIPGLNYQTLADIEKIHKAEDIVNVNEAKLRKELESLPCCATSEDGKDPADPLNLVFIGNAKDLLPAFIRRGWHPAEKNHFDSARKTVSSFLFGLSYRYSPVSSLYAFGRKQDLALQKARGSINQRQHLRLWLTPIKYQGKDVWVGQVSRDIGVRFTNKSPILVTHKIDPDIDEARNELIQEMLFSRGLDKIGYAGGIPKSTPDAPAYNMTGDPYFSDGLRAVLLMSEGLTPLKDVGFFHWKSSALNGRHLNITK